MANQIISAALAYILIPFWGLAGAVVVIVLNPFIGATASGCLLFFTYPNRFCLYNRKTMFQCTIVFSVSVIPLLLIQHGTGFYQWFPEGRVGNLIAAGVLGLASVVTIGVASSFLNIKEFQSGQQLLANRVKNLFRHRVGVGQGE